MSDSKYMFTLFSLVGEWDFFLGSDPQVSTGGRVASVGLVNCSTNVVCDLRNSVSFQGFLQKYTKACVESKLGWAR